VLFFRQVPRCGLSQRHPNKIKGYSAVRWYPAPLIARVAALYLARGGTVADVTYGKRRFWCLGNPATFTLLKSDLTTCSEAPYDFRASPTMRVRSIM